jgi:hypothetical protein
MTVLGGHWKHQLRGATWKLALYGLLVAGAVSYLCMK